ncbi:MAG: hypothetical protein BECKG1743F_GA0114225_104373 [Candidatus Kentron sp. G]|nr:MAG: hypothetical protein BECKG1743F_GA0114225_104373 [Candidatus Kentron sp. G]
MAGNCPIRAKKPHASACPWLEIAVFEQLVSLLSKSLIQVSYPRNLRQNAQEFLSIGKARFGPSLAFPMDMMAFLVRICCRLSPGKAAPRG